MSRTRRTAASFLTSLLSTLVTIVGGFIVTPIVLRLIGDEAFGASRVSLDVFGYLSFFDLGFAGALLPVIARADARNDVAGVESTTGAGIRFYILVSLGMVVGGSIASIFLGRLIPVSAEHHRDLRIGWFALLAGLIAVPLRPFRSLAEARQLGWIVNAAIIPQYLVTAGSSIALGYAGLGIRGQLAAHGLGVGVSHLILAICGIAAFPRILTASLRRAPPEVRAALWSLSGPTLLFGICGRVSYLTDNIIVGALLGPTMVVPLVMTQRLASLAQGQLQYMGNATWAGLAELHARGDLATFNARLVELTKLVGLVGTVMLAPIVAFNERFVGLWVGEGHYASHAITVVASLAAYTMAIQSLWLWSFFGTGKVRTVLSIQVVSTLINVALSIVFTLKWGAVGPSLGTLVALGATILWHVPRLMEREFQCSAGALVGAAVAPLVLGAPVVAGLWWLVRAQGSLTLPYVALEMTGAALVHGALCWGLVLGRDERAALKNRLSLMAFPR